ncbi:cocaine- and amphetamine-regulated transcript protein-like [Pseudochaenichthys georgianus]|uniref:cocaine- and amphetamine-regulated transcript protein-like n=1 Tax=Pseudochaenichthys georgianus TaxID=52239 RepID=UPI0039C1ABFD
MESVRAAVYLSVCLSLLTSLCQGQRSPEMLFGLTDKELVRHLSAFLDQADSSVSLSVEKKASVIPRCDVGERCAMRHGPRIGRLCDCLRGTACNTFFLRCLLKMEVTKKTYRVT